MSISVNTLLTTSTIDSDSNWMTTAYSAVALPVKLRSLPSPNVFEKWQSGWVTLPHKAVLETAAFLVCHHLTINGSRIGIWTLFSILRGWCPNTHRRCDRWNGSLCRCCPGYSWMKAKWLSWLSNRPLNGASVRIRTPNSTFVSLRDKSIFTTEA